MAAATSKGRGFKPSDPAKLAAMHGTTHPRLRAVRFPPAFSLEAHAPGVMDQGSGRYGTSSCGGHGSSVGVATCCAMRGSPLPFVPSPKGIYTNARSVDRAMRADGTLESLTDDGIDPYTLLTTLANEGVRPIQAPTSDGRYSDCEPATINDPETLTQDAQALKSLVVGERAIDPRASDFLPMVAAAIASGCPVGVGIEATNDFENWVANDAAPLDSATSYTRADHWVVALAYRTEADGSLTFLIRNSWGIGWGASGNIWVTGRWLQASCAEAIVFDVAIQGAA